MDKNSNRYSTFCTKDGDQVWPTDLWISFQKHLVTAEVIMQLIGQQYEMDFLTNIVGFGKLWPARRLIKST